MGTVLLGPTIPLLRRSHSGPAPLHFFYRLTVDAVPFVLGKVEVVATLGCLLEQRFRMGNLRVVLDEVPDGLPNQVIRREELSSADLLVDGLIEFRTHPPAA